MNCMVYRAGAKAFETTTIVIPSELVDVLSIVVFRLMSMFGLGGSITKEPGKPLIIELRIPNTSEKATCFREEVELAIKEAKEKLAAAQ